MEESLDLDENRIREGFSRLATIKGLKKVQTHEALKLKKKTQNDNCRKLAVALMQNRLSDRIK